MFYCCNYHYRNGSLPQGHTTRLFERICLDQGTVNFYLSQIELMISTRLLVNVRGALHGNTYPPKLLAIPMVWFAWYIPLTPSIDNNASSETYSTRATAALSVLITVQTVVTIAQAAYAIPAFVEWCGPMRDEVNQRDVEVV